VLKPEQGVSIEERTAKTLRPQGGRASGTTTEEKDTPRGILKRKRKIAESISPHSRRRLRPSGGMDCRGGSRNQTLSFKMLWERVKGREISLNNNKKKLRCRENFNSCV